MRARELRRCRHGWHGDGTYFVRTTQPWNIEPHVSPHVSAIRASPGECACRSVNSSVNNWTETHHQLERQTCPSQVEGHTFPSHMKQNKGTRKRHSFVLRVLTHAGRVPAVVLSFSQFSRLAVTRAWLFALNKLIRGEGDLRSLWPASSENVLVNLLLLHCGHCLWDWTFPHGSRKQQTNVCTG